MVRRRRAIWSVGASLVLGLCVATAEPAVAEDPSAVEADASVPSEGTPSDRLPAGGSLQSGTDLVSPNGGYRLTVSANGAPQLLDPAGTVLWSPKAAGAGATLRLRTDGKLVLYTASGVGAWYGPPTATGAELLVLDSGQVAVFVDRTARWWTSGGGIVQTGTAPAYPDPATVPDLAAGTSITAGTDVVSANGDYRLAVSANGAAQLLDQAGTVLWSPGRAAGKGAVLRLRPDGKLVLYTASGVGAWYGPPSNEDAVLSVTDSGQVAVFVGTTASWWTRDGRVVRSGTPPEYPGDTPPAATRTAALQPFLTSSPWNTPVGSGAQFEGEDGEVTQSFLTHGKPVVNRDSWSIAVYTATTSDPVTTLVGTVDGARYRGYVPADTTAPGGTDREVSIIQPNGTEAYGIYDWGSISGTTATSQIVLPVDLLGTGWGSGTRAASTPNIAGLIRNHELEQNEIQHAVAMALPRSALEVGPVWPAISQDGDTSEYTGDVPMGTLFAIPGDVDVTGLGLTDDGLALARALQDFGAYVVDSAGTNALYCEVACNVTDYNELNAAWKQLEPLMRAMTNNSETNVGGGGTPRVTPPPEVQ